MKKIFFLLIALLSISLYSCKSGSDDRIIGEWETAYLVEDDWWYYLNEDGSQTETYYYTDEYPITQDNPEWYVLRITNMFISIIDGNDEEISLMDIPFTYSYKDDQLSSILLSGDYTNTVTVSFPNDNTMIFYMDDSGDMEDGNGYEHYESWTTFRRVK